MYTIWHQMLKIALAYGQFSGSASDQAAELTMLPIVSCLRATHNRSFRPFVLAITPLGRSSRVYASLFVAVVAWTSRGIFVGDGEKFKIDGTWTSEDADKTAKSYNILMYF